MSFSFYTILFTIICFHSLYHSLIFSVTHCYFLSLVVIRCHSLSFVATCFTRCHSIYIRCHSLSLVVIGCTICCHWLYHLFSFVVTRCHSLYHSFSLDARLACFYKRSFKTGTIFLQFFNIPES